MALDLKQYIFQYHVRYLQFTTELRSSWSEIRIFHVLTNDSFPYL